MNDEQMDRLICALDRQTEVQERTLKYVEIRDAEILAHNRKIAEENSEHLRMRKEEYRRNNLARTEHQYREQDFLLMQSRPWWRKLLGMKYRHVK